MSQMTSAAEAFMFFFHPWSFLKTVTHLSCTNFPSHPPTLATFFCPLFYYPADCGTRHLVTQLTACNLTGNTRLDKIPSYPSAHNSRKQLRKTERKNDQGGTKPKCQLHSRQRPTILHGSKQYSEQQTCTHHGWGSSNGPSSTGIAPLHSNNSDK